MRSFDEKLLNLSAYEHYQEVLISSVGTQIALSIYEAEPDSPCVIFLPGTMTHPLFYDEFLAGLAKQGYNVIGLHFVSHGKSPRGKIIYGFSDLLQNVQDAVTYCLENYNDNIVLMGNSQGGILSLAAAAVDGRIRAAFPHGVLLPKLEESLLITRLPRFLMAVYELLRLFIRLLGWLLPFLPVPIYAYLKPKRVSRSPELYKLFVSDPIGLRSYPLYFLASLVNADLSGISNGRISCPIVVIAARQDPIFSFSYVSKVYKNIAAPKKEMLVFDEPYHLIFNEATERILEPISEKLREYTTGS